ncbi:hypothetical protein ACFL43_05375 [Thermodesulfobacteriota bacterium]
MNNRITLLVLGSKTGPQKRISISKNLLYCIIIVFVFLLGSGIIGAWKYRENVRLQTECLLLEAQKGQYEAVARTVSKIKTDEAAIRKLLGLEREAEQKETP